MSLDLSTLQLGEVQTTGKGAKSAPITQDGSPATFTPPPMEVAYAPSAFQNEDSTRVNITWRPDAPVEEFLESLDEWVLKEVEANSMRLFGKVRTKDFLKDSYTPILKKSEKWASQFKSKLNLGDPSKGKIWDPDGQPRDAPQAWQGCVTRPLLRLKSIDLMGQSFGAVLECTDIQIIEEAAPASTCPF